MKELVQHMLNTEINNLANRSYLNYFTKGLHCVKLVDNDDCEIAMYIALPDENNLESNFYNKSKGRNFITSVSSNYSDKTIVVAKGKLVAFIYEDATDKNPNHGQVTKVKKYKNNSVIGQPIYTEVDTSFIRLTDKHIINEGKTRQINANTFHTYATFKEELVVWFEILGEYPGNFEDVVYNNIDPSKLLNDNMLRTPSSKYLSHLLTLVLKQI